MKNITKLITGLFFKLWINLRPTEIQAAIARNQFKRLNTIKKLKNQIIKNYKLFKKSKL